MLRPCVALAAVFSHRLAHDIGEGLLLRVALPHDVEPALARYLPLACKLEIVVGYLSYFLLRLRTLLRYNSLVLRLFRLMMIFS